MSLSEPDVLDRLRTARVPELQVNPTALVAAGESRTRRRKWMRSGGVLAAAAVIGVAYLAVADVPWQHNATPPVAPASWVADEYDSVTLLEGTLFAGPDGQDEFTVTVTREAGDDTTTVDIVASTGDRLQVTSEPGPPGVEVFKAGRAYLLLWSSDPDVDVQILAGADENPSAGTDTGGASQSAAFELAGEPMFYMFLPHALDDLVITDLVLSTEAGVVTASGAAVHEVRIDHRGEEWRLVWIPDHQHWADCTNERCLLTDQYLQGGVHSGRELEGEVAQTVVAMLPGDAQDIRLVIDGEVAGTVSTAPVADRLFVVGSVGHADEYEAARQDQAPTIVWTDAAGTQHPVWGDAD